MPAPKKPRQRGTTPQPRSRLTPLQQRFVQEYLLSPSATEAYKRAGGKATGHSAESAASQLLRNIEVSTAIAKAQAARAERLQVNQDYVLRNLTEIIERCMQRAPVMVHEGRELVQATDADGNHLWTFNGKVAVAALHLVGKHLDMFGKKVGLSDDELNALLARELTRVAGSSPAATAPGAPADAHRGCDGCLSGNPGESPPVA